MPEDPKMLQAAAALSQILLVDAEPVDVLRRICDITVSCLDACDMASVSLYEGKGRVDTVVSTHDKISHLDRVQYDTRQGPCIAAATDMTGDRRHAVYEVPDTATETRWPDFARAAHAAGVGSIAAFALGVGTGSIGALNLYALEPHAFGDEDLRAAAVFAAHAAVVLANAAALGRARAEVAQLHEALDTRDVIGRAKGILMEREGVTDDQAFEILKRLSQHLNIKLREVAREIVERPTRRGGRQLDTSGA